ncbi:MAG TPA: hypothetical protein ENI64_11455 [Gammaproteobacteria bacterium]|nr:hypothetical protein [Gammaproteobacteria bacterium]
MKKFISVILLPIAFFLNNALADTDPTDYSLYLELATDNVKSDRAYMEFSARSNAHSFSVGAGAPVSVYGPTP